MADELDRLKTKTSHEFKPIKQRDLLAGQVGHGCAGTHIMPLFFTVLC